MSKKIKNNHKIKYLEIIKNNIIKISNQKTKIGQIYKHQVNSWCYFNIF